MLLLNLLKPAREFHETLGRFPNEFQPNIYFLLYCEFIQLIEDWYAGREAFHLVSKPQWEVNSNQNL